MKNLEPCDICGGRMEIVKRGLWWIECQACGRKTICAPPDTEAREVCIKRWNSGKLGVGIQKKSFVNRLKNRVRPAFLR